MAVVDYESIVWDGVKERNWERKNFVRDRIREVYSKKGEIKDFSKNFFDSVPRKKGEAQIYRIMENGSKKYLINMGNEEISRIKIIDPYHEEVKINFERLTRLKLFRNTEEMGRHASR
ncbi:hypothetical protein BMS3Abin17_00651 [archaeon BMS3Abin17]|nr:hypothetical protein BMS3Abin17_00651 [archaeon BMS3Abin17]HDZ60534.1 hypothetical protein [Candidatus Pacearchaeota archaeon]